MKFEPKLKVSRKIQNPNQGKASLVWQNGHVSSEDRISLLGQYPATLWLTGLSGAGKSTLAYALERHLTDMGRACYVLDGDNVRHGLNRDLGFSAEHRTENIRRIAEVAQLMNDAGLIVISAFISPYRADREMARKIIGENMFFEVYVSTPMATCEQRDTKGLYQRARAGGLANFTGISAPYEPPEKPAASIDTSLTSLSESLDQLIQLFSQRLKLESHIKLKTAKF